MRRLSLNGQRKLKEFEGCKLTAYRCPAGVWTIGFGFIDGVKEGDTMTQVQADQRLIYELREYEAAVFVATYGQVAQNEFDACVILSWNIGIGGMETSTVIRMHNRGDKVAAAKAFALWNKVNGKVNKGLVRRRAAEAALYLTPDDVAPIDMPQKIDTEKPVSVALHAIVEAFFRRFV